MQSLFPAIEALGLSIDEFPALVNVKLKQKAKRATGPKNGKKLVYYVNGELQQTSSGRIYNLSNVLWNYEISEGVKLTPSVLIENLGGQEVFNEAMWEYTLPLKKKQEKADVLTAKLLEVEDVTK